ncbi:MAG: electron transfer flavoprotein subunit beta/FixA family protein [Clostridia bacterium]|nr:electron transfer flavoprotein subunit beta/FixA family protein [Clostridia bacterium]
MKIAVCIKQVPKTTEIRIDPVTNTLIRDGIPSIINPDDKSALEVALRIKEQTGAEIHVVCMGPGQAEIALREALAMGADEAYLVTDRAFAGSDTLATSTIIADALKYVGFDYIIAGRQAIDGDTAQVGPQIAEHLGIPQITYCADFNYDKQNNVFKVKRQLEDRYQILSVAGPALFTVLSSSITPRYMNVADIIAQDDKELHILTYADLQCNTEHIGLKGSPTKVKSTFTKQYNSDKQLVDTTPEEAARIIAELLKAKHII